MDRAELAVMASEVTGNIHSQPVCRRTAYYKGICIGIGPAEEKMQAIIMAAGKRQPIGAA